ncbi:MAG: TetR/AcrR family transcriptional regulator [Anaerolineae bacterium]|nr:TetR/AcrR family transcriptional regulator [Anaerolineae bacterium]
MSTPKKFAASEKSSYHHGDLKNALIEAGIEILARDGVNGLSLRKVARKAGVSHAAPYAHFADKQALVAAIATDGHRKLHAKIVGIMEQYPDDPLRQLVETAWAYVEFGFEEPDHFRITFSGAVEKERDYPALVEMTANNFGILRALVSRCQAAGFLNPGEPDLAAVSVWGLIHGFVSLIQEGQISHSVLSCYSLWEMLIFVLNQVSRVKIDPQEFVPHSVTVSPPRHS